MRNFIYLCLLLFVSGVGLYIFRGLLEPDPLEFGVGEVSFAAAPAPLKALLLLVPLGWACGVAVLFGFWLRFLNPTLFFVSIVSAVVAGLLAYPVVSEVVYARKLSHDLTNFHPFLQLTPPEIVARKDDAVPRVLFLGGSTTAWRDSHNKSWPEYAEALSGGAFEALGSAREWYTSLHSVHQYVSRFRNEDIQVVVVMHAINDLLINAEFGQFSTGAFRNDYGHFLGPIRDLVQPRTIARSIADIPKRFWYHSPRKEIRVEHYPGLEPFRTNLRTIVELARLDGREVLLLTQPHIYRDDLEPEARQRLYMLNIEAAGDGYRWDFESALFGMQLYNDAVRQLGAELGVQVVDAEQAVPKTLEYFKDDVHYTDAAYPIVAEMVSEALRDLL